MWADMWAILCSDLAGRGALNVIHVPQRHPKRILLRLEEWLELRPYASSAAVAMQISRRPEPRRSMRFMRLNTSTMIGLRLSLFTHVATTSSGSGSTNKQTAPRRAMLAILL